MHDAHVHACGVYTLSIRTRVCILSVFVHVCLLPALQRWTTRVYGVDSPALVGGAAHGVLIMINCETDNYAHRDHAW